jgi:hypothetical protein
MGVREWLVASVVQVAFVLCVVGPNKMACTLAAGLVALQCFMHSRNQGEPAGVAASPKETKSLEPTPPAREVVAAPKLPSSWSRKDAAKDFDGLPEAFVATQVSLALRPCTRQRQAAPWCISADVAPTPDGLASP